jgi:hypothetical protein
MPDSLILCRVDVLSRIRGGHANAHIRSFRCSSARASAPPATHRQNA